MNGRSLPPEQGLRLRLADARGGDASGWIAVRPSGTEPKLKCYLEIGDPGAESREPVVARLAGVKAALAEWFAAA